MRLTAAILKLKRGRNWRRCQCCGRVLRPEDRIFFQVDHDAMWCSVRCAERHAMVETTAAN